MVSGQPVPLIAYPHSAVAGRTGKRGMGPRSMGGVAKSGHVGIFRRRGAARLPIEELLGSRPVDALLHEGEADAVAARGVASRSPRRSRACCRRRSGRAANDSAASARRGSTGCACGRCVCSVLARF